MHYLGWLYHNGLGVTQDYAKAREWFAKSAEKGYAKAMLYLGWFYQYGLGGVTKDYAKAREWFVKADNAGHKDAKEQIAEMDKLLAQNTNSASQTTASNKPQQASSSVFADFRERTNNLNIDMVAVRGGTFTMGCTAEQGSDCNDDEKPAHTVTVSDFYIGKYEVTQAQWVAVMGSNPSYHKGDNLPVGYVCWDDIQEFIRKLNSLTGKTYRLPTEAEWEFAARGGNKSAGYKYSGSNNIDNVAWYKNNSDDKTHAVGSKSPNELGIYDMTGNVYEWCRDWYDENYYSSSPQTNPKGANSGSACVLRGGSWSLNAQNCRVSYRDCYPPSTRDIDGGFRLCLVP
jgi:formylglycine-generating enzyme required for sulfatase activity